MNDATQLTVECRSRICTVCRDCEHAALIVSNLAKAEVYPERVQEGNPFCSVVFTEPHPDRDDEAPRFVARVYGSRAQLTKVMELLP